MRILAAPAALLLLTACSGAEGGVGAPVFEQSNVHFSQCPAAPVSSATTCTAVATLHNSGSAGTSREVFYYSLSTGDKKQQASCAPTVPSIPAGGSQELSCTIEVPAGAVPTDLFLSGR